ncbi:MAG: hypothetical protein M1832_002965 [Thelocarpon impressellum]|nr:MAG: hypothetical protein M1832_002965 [Thelocarpon impressellum]
MQSAPIILPADISGSPSSAAISSPDNPTHTSQTTPCASASASTNNTSTSAVVDHLPSPFANEDDLFAGVAVSQPPLTVVPVHRRRRSSKLATMPAIIKRSASTPNVRGQAAAEAAALSLAADKRRNKLGYHRTSVACGHCRRRKIRCLLAPEDPTGRCLNCIRLKKECNFFPVDQQPQPDHSSRSGSKIGRVSSNDSSSASPSPPLPVGSMHDRASAFRGYGSVSHPSLPQDLGLSLDGRSGSVSSLKSSRLHSVAGAQRPHLANMETAQLFANGDRRTSMWEGSPYDQSPVSGEPRSGLEDPSTNFWRLADSPMTPAFSAYGGPSPITPMHHRDSVGTFSFSGNREDLAWPVPSSRSMSVGHFEGYPKDYSGHYGLPAQDFKHPQPTNIYPPSLNTSNISMASVSEPQSAATDAQGVPITGTFGTQTGWNPSFVANTMSGMTGKGVEGLGGWYTEPGHLAQVEEEAPGLHFHEEAPIIYQPGAQSAT